MQTPHTIRYPKALRPGGLIGVTAPSAGIAPALEPRLQYGLSTLRALGYATREGRCLRASGTVSAPPTERAAELQRMLLDPDIALVLPPWGG
jgi:muramoyltetrapeptide carboxypeptidase LdcA involved in peptidoglycan recycling